MRYRQEQIARLRSTGRLASGRLDQVVGQRIPAVDPGPETGAGSTLARRFNL
jgi:hypothetical protein